MLPVFRPYFITALNCYVISFSFKTFFSITMLKSLGSLSNTMPLNKKCSDKKDDWLLRSGEGLGGTREI